MSGGADMSHDGHIRECARQGQPVRCTEVRACTAYLRPGIFCEDKNCVVTPPFVLCRIWVIDDERKPLNVISTAGEHSFDFADLSNRACSALHAGSVVCDR